MVGEVRRRLHRPRCRTDRSRPTPRAHRRRAARARRRKCSACRQADARQIGLFEARDVAVALDVHVERARGVAIERQIAGGAELGRDLVIDIFAERGIVELRLERLVERGLLRRGGRARRRRRRRRRRDRLEAELVVVGRGERVGVLGRHLPRRLRRRRLELEIEVVGRRTLGGARAAARATAPSAGLGHGRSPFARHWARRSARRDRSRRSNRGARMPHRRRATPMTGERRGDARSSSSRSPSIAATPPPEYSTSDDTDDIRATRSRNLRASSNAPVCVPLIASSSWR